MPSSSRPKILIIYTGGTIGMIENPVTHTLQPFDFSHLIDNVPKVKKLAYDIEHLQFDPPIDSSNMNPTHWAEIALAIEKHYDAFDGFVVLHGTDTMAFTASALSFMLENLHKPGLAGGGGRGCAWPGHGARSGHPVRELSVARQSQHQDECRQLQCLPQ